MTNKFSMYLFADAERFNKTIYGKGIKPFRSSGTIFILQILLLVLIQYFKVMVFLKNFKR